MGGAETSEIHQQTKKVIRTFSRDNEKTKFVFQHIIIKLSRYPSRFNSAKQMILLSTGSVSDRILERCQECKSPQNPKLVVVSTFTCLTCCLHFYLSHLWCPPSGGSRRLHAVSSPPVWQRTLARPCRAGTRQRVAPPLTRWAMERNDRKQLWIIIIIVMFLSPADAFTVLQSFIFKLIPNNWSTYWFE